MFRLHEKQGKSSSINDLDPRNEFAVVRAPTLETNLTPETTTQKHVDAETKRIQRKKLLTKNPARKRRRKIIKNPYTETQSPELISSTTTMQPITTRTTTTTETTTSMMMILPTRTGRRLGTLRRRKGKNFSTERMNSREQIGSRRADGSRDETKINTSMNKIEPSTWKYKDDSGFTRFENFTPGSDSVQIRKPSRNERQSFEMDVDARVRELTESIMKLREEIALLQSLL